MELFTTLRCGIPLSIKEYFRFYPENPRLLLMIPRVRLEVSKQNFVFRATEIWNKMVKRVFQRINNELSGLIIPGSTPNSDLSASVRYIKNQIK